MTGLVSTINSRKELKCSKKMKNSRKNGKKIKSIPKQFFTNLKLSKSVVTI